MATLYSRSSIKRMPYVINTATAIFYKTINRIMEGVDGVRDFIDDILIWGCTKERTNERRLQSALERIKAINLYLNKSKCEMRVEKITFLGNSFTRDGLQPDHRKIQAINEMKHPETKEDVTRAVGVITTWLDSGYYIEPTARHCVPCLNNNNNNKQNLYSALYNL